MRVRVGDSSGVKFYIEQLKHEQEKNKENQNEEVSKSESNWFRAPKRLRGRQGTRIISINK